MENKTIYNQLYASTDRCLDFTQRSDKKNLRLLGIECELREDEEFIRSKGKLKIKGGRFEKFVPEKIYTHTLSVDIEDGWDWEKIVEKIVPIISNSWSYAYIIHPNGDYIDIFSFEAEEDCLMVKMIL